MVGPKWFHKRLDDDRGNVSTIFALTLLPMIGFVGLGIDVSRTLSAKTTLDAAADAAALSAATETQSTLQSPVGAGATGVAISEYAGQLAGTQIFAVDAAKVGGWIGGTPTPLITVGDSNQIITAQASYSADVPTVFGSMFGVRTMHIAGTSAATLALPKYLNISVAVDVSQSMGLASTSAYMTQMQGLTGGCAFGCHVYQPGQTGGSQPYEVQAHNAGIQLRIDVIRTATQNMIQTAQSLQGSSGMISFGLYALQGGPPSDSAEPSLPLTVLSSSSSNYSALISAANGIDLGPNTSAGIGDTDFTDSIPALTAAVPTSGDGSTSAKAQQFVFLMTDGVQDINGSCTDGHCTQAFNPAQCAALKAKGVTVGVIYTTYLAMPTEQTYRDLVAPFASQIAPNLQSCASSGWFYQATDASDIQNAINALFAQATSHGVLTQ